MPLPLRRIWQPRGDERLGLDGWPVLLKEGYAKWTAHFDASGNQTELAFFGVDGKPTLSKDGFAGWMSEFDRGNRIATTFVGADGRPILRKEGFARIVCEYDEKNLPTKTCYFDDKGKPVARRVVVTVVRAGSQADRLGLRHDDVLCEYAGQPITDLMSFLYRRRSERTHNRRAELKVLRGDTTLRVTLSPGLLGATLKDDSLPVAKKMADEKPNAPPLKQAASVEHEKH